MKKDIHPTYRPTVYIDDKWELLTYSCMESGETRMIDGVEHQVIKVSISSHSHPFWTGQQRLVDAAGRLERFNRKFGAGRVSAKSLRKRAAEKAAEKTAEKDAATAATAKAEAN